MAGPLRPMWTCPRCGRSYAISNQSHACLSLTPAQHLAEKGPLAEQFYRAVVDVLSTCGEFRIHAQKTRIAFISRMSFAGLTFARNWANLTFILPNPVDHPRIRKLTLYGPTSWGHSLRLTGTEEIDDQVRKSLCEAWRRGNQETLDPGATVTPIRGRLLEVFETAFQGTVSAGWDGLFVVLPNHVSAALALVDEVEARAKGTRYRAKIRKGKNTMMTVDRATGLAEGDRSDFFIG